MANLKKFRILYRVQMVYTWWQKVKCSTNLGQDFGQSSKSSRLEKGNQTCLVGTLEPPPLPPPRPHPRPHPHRCHLRIPVCGSEDIPQGMSATFGKLPFPVDTWAAKPGVSKYFLTHMHSDHTQGLCDGWSAGTLRYYCLRAVCDDRS